MNSIYRRGRQGRMPWRYQQVRMLTATPAFENAVYATLHAVALANARSLFFKSSYKKTPANGGVQTNL